MFVSKKKKEENIVEYLLYMWQIEDLVRSCNFDIKILDETVISKSPYNKEEKQQLTEWYLDLMHQLESENKQASGHTSDLDEIMDELEKVHNFLIKIKQNESYYSLYIKTSPIIEELKKESHQPTDSDIKVAIEFIYGFLLLRLQNKSISKSTTDALKAVSIFCYELADKYKDFKHGYLTISQAQNN